MPQFVAFEFPKCFLPRLLQQLLSEISQFMSGFFRFFSQDFPYKSLRNSLQDFTYIPSDICQGISYKESRKIPPRTF